jgi:[histone H3]-lysine4 N-trimethyltransferase SETD1
MSRSSKGFADFFPTAPSVLQQKRSKAAQLRKRPKSPSISESKPPLASSLPRATPKAQADKVNVSNGGDRGSLCVESASEIQDDSECVAGDLLNGVGSASSTSTTSSIFSTSHGLVYMAHSNEAQKSTSLTPLTTADSSPPPNPLDSPNNPRFLNGPLPGRKSNGSPSRHKVIEASLASRSPFIHPLSRFQARPVAGEAKGLKVIYDPDLDKKLSSKERKSRQPLYDPFGQEVGLILQVFCTALFLL